MKQLITSLQVAVTAVVLATALPAGQAVTRPAAAPTHAELFDDRVLQKIELQVSERDWATLRENYLQNTYYPATLVWQGQSARNVGIRSRGSGTRSGTKPNLLVDFDRYVGGQRFLGLEGLVLDNHLQDPSAMREAITMALFTRLGLPAPREAAAALYINGSLFGVYNLVERVDEVALRRMFDRPVEAAPPPPAGGARTPPPGSSGTRAPSQPRRAVPVGPPPAPGEPSPVGYLFDYGWLDRFVGTYPGPDLDFYADRFEAETRDDEPLETVFRPIAEMFRAINEAPDERFVETVAPWLDLPQFVRIVAVQAFMAEWDGLLGEFGMNNFYLYRPAAGPPHVFIPWDADNTFHTLEHPVDTGMAENVPMRRAMAVPGLRALFFETLEEAARLSEATTDATGLGWLESEVRRRAGLMRGPMADDRVKPYSQDEFEAAVAFNGEFARRRAAIVRQQAAALQAAGR